MREIYSNPCPLCKGFKKERFMVCPVCRQRATGEYEDYKKLCRKEAVRVKSWDEWIVNWGDEMISSNLPLLEQELKLAQESLAEISAKRSERIEKEYKTRIISLSTAARVHSMVEKTEGKKAWQELNGSAAIYRIETAAARLKEAQRLLNDLAVKKTEFASEPSVLAQVKQFLDRKIVLNKPDEDLPRNHRPQQKAKGGRAGENYRLKEAVNSGELESIP